MTKKTVLAVVNETGKDPGSGNLDYHEGWGQAVACIYDALSELPDGDDPEELRRIIIAMCRDRYGAMGGEDVKDK